MKPGNQPQFEDLPQVDPAQVMVTLAKNGFINEVLMRVLTLLLLKVI